VEIDKSCDTGLGEDIFSGLIHNILIGAYSPRVHPVRLTDVKRSPESVD